MGRGVYRCLLVAVLGGYAAWAILRPIAPFTPVVSSTAPALSTTNSTLVWPPLGQAAIGIAGTSIIETHGPQTPVPIASAAKVVSALTILREKPLQLGETGPIITLTADDVARYNAYVAQNGSVVPVAAGAHITQYQALQAMLIPSSNNLADSLAIWAFGSLEAYVAAANVYVAEFALKNTHISTDASGLDPGTTSTAEDLVKLGKLAMRHPVVAQIVGQATVDSFPVASIIKNTNSLLGTNNIIGIKTGTSDQAGSVFMGAARTTVNNTPVTIVTALVGASNRPEALAHSKVLLDSAQINFKPVTVVKAGTTVGRYTLPWDKRIVIPAVTTKDLTVTTWNGDPVATTTSLKPLPAHTEAGQVVGSITTQPSAITDRQSVAIQLKTTVSPPSAWWRLTHPLP